MSHRSRPHRAEPVLSALVAAVTFLAWAAGVSFAVPAAAHDAVSTYLFVPNRDSADVAVIDTRTDTLVARVPVGRVPHQVVVSTRTDRLVASNTADNTITIVDLHALRPVATLALDTEPEHMELSPDGTLLAVGNIGAGTVSLVALPEGRERARVSGLIEPHNLTFSRDGTRLFVANLGGDHVSVIDVAAGRVVEEIPVAAPTALAATPAASDAEYQGIINVTSTPDRRFGFAAHGESNSLAVIDLEAGRKVRTLKLGELPWRAYATADGRTMIVPNNGDRTVSIIDTAGSADGPTVVATLPGGADMTGVNTANDGTTAFVISRGEDRIVVLDLVARKYIGDIALPGTPETGIVTPDGRKLYVALSSSDQVAVIDVATRTLVRTIDDVGDGPWGTSMVAARNYCH